MQSDGGTVEIDIQWEDVVVDPVISGIETLLRENLANWISDAWESIVDTFLGDVTTYLETKFEQLLGPIVGTPAPEGSASPAPLDIAFSSATNSPWDTLISDVYFGGIVGLALGIQFITWAVIGLRFKSINPVIRQKLGRRCLIAFLSLFFWLPVASVATQFFDIVGRQIVLASYSGEDAVATLVSLGAITSQDWGAGLLLLVLAGYVYLKALFVFLTRWILTILLTVAMPLVASFWVLEIWPFNRFAGLSKQVAGAYPGLLAAGIPPAILIRISLATTAFGFEDLSFYVATITLYLAAKSQSIMIRRSSRTATRLSEQVLAGAKQSVTKPAKIGGATAGVAATAGVGSVYGASAAMKAGGALNTAANVAKGRTGRAARSVQMVHRNLSNASTSGGGDPSGGSPNDVPGPETPQQAANGSPVSESVGMDDDDKSMSTAPVSSSDDDPPDDAGAGQTNASSYEDVFAGGDDPLGPDYYRTPSDADDS